MAIPNAKILIIVSLVSFCSDWQFGYQTTYINTAVEDFRRLDNEIYVASRGQGTDTQKEMPFDVWSRLWSISVSTFYVGACIGFLIVPFLVRYSGGVRLALLYSSFPAVLGSGFQFFVRSSINEIMFTALLSAGRLLIGIQAGCSLCLLPLFIMETSTSENRPFLSSLQQVFQALATLIGLVVGSHLVVNLGARKVEWLVFVGLVPNLAFILMLIVLPETPFRLMEKCHGQNPDSNLCSSSKYKKKFEKSVNFYYGENADFKSIQQEAKDSWNASEAEDAERLTNPKNLKGMLIGSIAAISYTFTGDDLIDSYSADFLSRASDLSSSTAELLTISFGILLFITSCIGAFLIDRFGRKRLLVAGLIGTAFSNLVAALGAAFSSAIVLTLGFALTKAFIGFGAGEPAWFLTSELVSPNVVAAAQAFSTGMLLVTTGLITLFFLSLQIWLGTVWALLVLSVVPATLISVFLFVMLPETKDRTYDKIVQLLGRPFPGLAKPKDKSSLVETGPETRKPEKETFVDRWSNVGGAKFRDSRLMSGSSYASHGLHKKLRTKYGHYGSIQDLSENPNRATSTKAEDFITKEI